MLLEFVNGGARGESINSLPSKYHTFWMLIFSFTRGERLREEKRTKAGVILPHLHLPPTLVVAVCQSLYLLCSLKHIPQTGATDTPDGHWECLLQETHLLVCSIAQPPLLCVLKGHKVSVMQ